MGKGKEKIELCQAEYHDPRFYNDDGEVVPHTADTVDHLTPRDIARSLAWKAKDFRNPDARVPMHTECHRLKESSTVARKELLVRQKQGELVTLEGYRQFRNKHDCVFTDGRRNGKNGKVNGKNGGEVVVYDMKTGES